MYLILATTNGFNFELNSSLTESIGSRNSKITSFDPGRRFRKEMTDKGRK